MSRFGKSALAAAVAVGLICTAGLTRAGAECYSWDSARSVIKENGLVSAGQVRRDLNEGRMIEFKLCKVRGRYVYRVVTMRPGRVNKTIVDAKSGATVERSDGSSSLPANVHSAIKNPFKFFKRRKKDY